MPTPFSLVTNLNRLLQLSSLHIQVPVNPNADHLFESQHAARDSRHTGSSLGGSSRTVDLALSFSFHTCSNPGRTTSSWSHLGIRGFQISQDTTLSAALSNTQAKFAAILQTLSPGLPCLSSLMMNCVRFPCLSMSDTIARQPVGLRPTGICLGLLIAKR